jgi:hypothetical protein
MFKRYQLFALLLAAAIFACTVPSAQSQTAGPPPLQVPAGFDIAFAMNALYGNYDAASGTSSSTAPKTGLDYTNFQPGQKETVKPFFAAANPPTGEVFLATYAVPATGDFDCHACAPLIGVAVFVKAGDSWKVVASEKTDLIFGQYAVPGTAQLFQFGPHHTGIQLSDTDGGQGVMDTQVILLVAWNGGFSQAWSGLVSSDDSMYCGPQTVSPCFGYKVDLKFEKGSNPEYDDLIATTSGTDLTDATPPVLKNVAGVQHLHFADGKYVAAASH